MSEESQGESLLAILDELADLLTHARAMPMSASVLVNRAEALELIESAKAVLPSQITRAQGVVADVDAVLGRARVEASDLVERAKERAARLVDQEEVVKQAEAKAQEIEQQARASADKLAREADDYCDRQLAQFEIDLNSIASQVAAGRARLTERNRSRGGLGTGGEATNKKTRRSLREGSNRDEGGRAGAAAGASHGRVSQAHTNNESASSENARKEDK